MKTYWPPARGVIAVNSAMQSAPASVSIPATAQASRTRDGDPTLQIITRAFRNMPVPTTLVTMSAPAGISVRPRARVGPDAGSLLLSLIGCTGRGGLPPPPVDPAP